MQPREAINLEKPLTYWLALALFGASTFAVSESIVCDGDTDSLSAHYTYTITDGTTERTFSRMLLRDPNRVSHAYLDQEIADTWILTSNQRLSMTRYFDFNAYALEYEPADLRAGEAVGSWESLQQIVDLTPLAEEIKAAIAAADGEANVIELQHDLGNIGVELRYNRSCDLVESFTASWEDKAKTITLTELRSDAAVLKEWYAKRMDYYATDYADLGDNESDPFLTRMIKLGYIEHGATGAYTPDGSPLGGNLGGHGHRH